MLIAGVLGLALSTGVIAYVGFGKIVAAFAGIGWRGLFALAGGFLATSAVLALAWWVLHPKPSVKTLPAFFLGRLVRDASGELLPFSSLGGFVFGARAAILGGVEPATAIATTVVDVTAEFIGQLGFTALGIALLAYRPEARQEDANFLFRAGLGLLAACVAAVVFVAFQRRASAMIERAVARWAPSALAQTSAVTASLHALYERARPLTLSSLIHFLAWVVGGVLVWAGLWVAGVHAYALRQIVGVEALMYALRTIGFAAPMGLGVIETGYALVGPLFGVSPEFALALSLIKRARDIVIGVPALALWQVLEGRSLAAQSRANVETQVSKEDCPETRRMGPS